MELLIIRLHHQHIGGNTGINLQLGYVQMESIWQPKRQLFSPLLIPKFSSQNPMNKGKD